MQSDRDTLIGLFDMKIVKQTRKKIMSGKFNKMESSHNDTHGFPAHIQISRHMHDRFIIENKHDETKNKKEKERRSSRDEISNKWKFYVEINSRRRTPYHPMCVRIKNELTQQQQYCGARLDVLFINLTSWYLYNRA